MKVSKLGFSIVSLLMSLSGALAHGEMSARAPEIRPLNSGYLMDRLERLHDLRDAVLAGNRPNSPIYMKILGPEAIQELEAMRGRLMAAGLSGVEVDSQMTRHAQGLLNIDEANLKKLVEHYDGKISQAEKFQEGVRAEQARQTTIQGAKAHGHYDLTSRAQVEELKAARGQALGSLQMIEIAQKELQKDSIAFEKTLRKHWRNMPREKRNIFLRTGSLAMEWAGMGIKAPFKVLKGTAKGTYHTLRIGGKLIAYPAKGLYRGGKFVVTHPVSVTAASVAVAAFIAGAVAAHSELDVAVIGAINETLDEARLALLSTYHEIMGRESEELEAKVEKEINGVSIEEAAGATDLEIETTQN